MKKLRYIITTVLLLSLLSLYLPACQAVETSFSFNREPVPDTLLVEGVSASNDESLSSSDENAPTDIIVTVNAPSVLESYLSRERDSDVSEYIFSEEGEKISSEAEDALENAQKQIEALGYTVTSSHNLIISALSTTVPYKEIDRIAALDSVKKAEIAPVLKTDGFVIDDDGFSAALETAAKAAEENDANSELPQSVINANKIYDIASAKGGEGQLIAIVDSGLLTNHEAFTVMPETETAKIKGPAYITSSMKQKLNGGERASYYLNQKVVFKYDYAEMDANVTPGLSQDSQHGTHVAGISAGNNGVDFFGVAPNAQLAIMKAFRNNSGEAYLSDLVSALEDSLIIGADVINMSLGLDAGVPQNTVYDEIVENLTAAGVSIIAAAGNSNKSTCNNRINSGLALTSDPDYSIISSPGSIKSPFMVASSGVPGKPYVVSSFSSWGPGSELSIKPEITAPGYLVNSSVSSGVSSYYEFSGTSMATPNITGVVAVMRSELRERTSLTGYAFSETVYNYLMSNAYVMTTDDGVPISPRSQGAGLADPSRALASPAYLTGKNGTRAKLELGDDETRAGKYAMLFELHNVSDKTLVYEITQKTVTERAENGLCLGEPRLLEPEFDVVSVRNGTLEGRNTVSVNARETAYIAVEIELSQADREYMDRTFEAGIYVEGFLFLDSESSRLNIPFLGFYGDWGEPATFDPFEGSTQTPVYSALTLTGKVSASSSGLKLGSYSYSGGSAFNTDYAALSFEDSKLNIISSINSVTPLRAFKELRITVTDFCTGEELFRSESLYGASPRAFKMQNNYTANSIGAIPVNLSVSAMGGEKVFANNGKYKLNMLPIGFDNEDGKPSSTVFYIDSEAPVITQAKKEDDILTLKLRDNHYVQATQFYYKQAEGSGSYVPLRNSFSKTIPDEIGGEFELSVNCSSFESGLNSSVDKKLYVFVTDFARNVSWYSFDISGDGEQFDAVDVVPPQRTETEYDKTLSENCFRDTDGVLYKALQGGYSLIDYPASLTLETYKVLDGTVRIERGAFENSALEKVILPKTLSHIGDDAFLACPSLERVIYLGNSRPVLETAKDAVYENFARAFDEYDNIYTAARINELLENFMKASSDINYYEYYVIKESYDLLSPEEKALIVDAETRLGHFAVYAEIGENYRNRLAALAAETGSPRA